MNNQNKLNFIIAIMVTAFIALACSGGDQQAEANKLVDTANAKLEEARKLMTETEARNNKLFSADVKNATQLKIYKEAKNDEAKSISADYGKVATSLSEISKSYDDASRLNVNEKYKEYAKIKSEEFAKRSSAVDVQKGNAQAFADIDDPKTMFEKFDENNEKSKKLMKEADELAEKAKKIESDNPEIFRKDAK